MEGKGTREQTPPTHSITVRRKTCTINSKKLILILNEPNDHHMVRGPHSASWTTISTSPLVMMRYVHLNNSTTAVELTNGKLRVIARSPTLDVPNLIANIESHWDEAMRTNGHTRPDTYDQCQRDPAKGKQVSRKLCKKLYI